uniref:Ubiquitin-like domain-containing protein n=1 Tax=Solanum lycopersicum TaxID=4081 RepID=K4AW67_SOLLC
MALESAAGVSPMTVKELTLAVKWSDIEYTVRFCSDDTVGDLKLRICEVTNVLPKRQKLLYPKVGAKFADDSLLLSQILFQNDYDQRGSLSIKEKLFRCRIFNKEAEMTDFSFKPSLIFFSCYKRRSDKIGK